MNSLKADRIVRVDLIVIGVVVCSFMWFHDPHGGKIKIRQTEEMKGLEERFGGFVTREDYEQFLREKYSAKD